MKWLRSKLADIESDVEAAGRDEYQTSLNKAIGIWLG